MGDGTTNTALKGSPKGRRQSQLPFLGTPAHHRGRGKRSRGLATCPPEGPWSSSHRGFPSGQGGPGMGFSCPASGFAEGALGSFGK